MPGSWRVLATKQRIEMAAQSYATDLPPGSNHHAAAEHMNHLRCARVSRRRWR
jgi:hypothetical protein